MPADRVLVVGQDAADDTREPGDALDLAAGLAALAGRGLTRVLAEGGPSLLADLLAADLVDELCVTTTPTLVGPGPTRIVAGAARPAATTALPVGRASRTCCTPPRTGPGRPPVRPPRAGSSR